MGSPIGFCGYWLKVGRDSFQEVFVVAGAVVDEMVGGDFDHVLEEHENQIIAPNERCPCPRERRHKDAEASDQQSDSLSAEECGNENGRGGWFGEE